MSLWRTLLPAAACLLLISGCFEDEAVITLNTDGSGTLSQRLTLSERFLIAVSEDRAPDNVPSITKDDIREQVGSALDITDIRETDLPDGGKVIEFEGTFDRPEQFFLSTFCRETLNIRLAPAGDGKAAIHHSMDSDSAASGGPSITQLYGLAKGMYVRRTIHLPAAVEQTNGQLSDDQKTVQWEMDLRDQQGLAKTKAFVEGPDKGKGIAVFDASALTFSLPLQMETPSKPAAQEHPDTITTMEAEHFQAEVIWVSCTKKHTADGQTETSDLEIGIELRWSDPAEPIRCGPVVLQNAMDDQLKDLLADANPRDFQVQISGFDLQNGKKQLSQRLATPSENARALKTISGYVQIVAGIQTEEIVLDDIQSIIGAESTGNAVLDQLEFKIQSIAGRTMDIQIAGGRNTIVSIDLLDENDLSISRRGGSGWGDNYSYNFAEDISGVQKCRLEVATDEDVVKAPFTLEEIPLP